MAAEERDSTADWLLPEGGIPTLHELEGRVDVALSVARAAETAAVEIGDAAIEAAEQAGRAAELAERASLAAAAGRGPAPPANGNGAATAPVTPVATAPAPPPIEPSPPELPSDRLLEDFVARADRVAGRLRDVLDAADAAPAFQSNN